MNGKLRLIKYLEFKALREKNYKDFKSEYEARQEG